MRGTENAVRRRKCVVHEANAPSAASTTRCMLPAAVGQARRVYLTTLRCRARAGAARLARPASSDGPALRARASFAHALRQRCVCVCCCGPCGQPSPLAPACIPKPPAYVAISPSAPRRPRRPLAPGHRRRGGTSPRARIRACWARTPAFAAQRKQGRLSGCTDAAQTGRTHRQQVAARGTQRRHDGGPLLQAAWAERTSQLSAVPSSPTPLARALRAHCGNVFLKSGSCDTPGHDASVGVPSVLRGCTASANAVSVSAARGRRRTGRS